MALDADFYTECWLQKKLHDITLKYKCVKGGIKGLFFFHVKKKTPQAVVGKHRLKTIDNGYGCC